MNYPNRLNKTYNRHINYENRGMSLEDDINKSNDYYRLYDLAIIYKKPTPITLMEVDYKNNIINKAKFKIPSTTDYNGIYKGKYIDFEAKETMSKTSFPLANIHTHQIEHLKSIYKHGGIGFIIVRFNKLGITFLLEINKLNIDNRKSIPLSYFKEYGYIIEEGFNPRLNYIKIIDKLLEV